MRWKRLKTAVLVQRRYSRNVTELLNKWASGRIDGWIADAGLENEFYQTNSNFRVREDRGSWINRVSSGTLGSWDFSLGRIARFQTHMKARRDEPLPMAVASASLQGTDLLKPIAGRVLRPSTYLTTFFLSFSPFLDPDFYEKWLRIFLETNGRNKILMALSHSFTYLVNRYSLNDSLVWRQRYK